MSARVEEPQDLPAASVDRVELGIAPADHDVRRAVTGEVGEAGRSEDLVARLDAPDLGSGAPVARCDIAGSGERLLAVAEHDIEDAVAVEIGGAGRGEDPEFAAGHPLQRQAGAGGLRIATTGSAERDEQEQADGGKQPGTVHARVGHPAHPRCAAPAGRA